MNGHVVWRVTVGHDEVTCLGCGETYTAGEHCPRCAGDDSHARRHGKLPPAVPTTSYLRHGEYELAR
jgi:hypothetical protein